VLQKRLDCLEEATIGYALEERDATGAVDQLELKILIM
jgi:hypothetical protein